MATYFVLVQTDKKSDSRPLYEVGQFTSRKDADYGAVLQARLHGEENVSTWKVEQLFQLAKAAKAGR